MSDASSTTQLSLGQKEFHIAPMLDVSTIEFRYFIRLLTKRAIIWTEMVVAETLVHRSKYNSVDDTTIQLDVELMRHCGWFDEQDCYDKTSCDLSEFVDPHPIVCQIGTNNPIQAAFATRVVKACGYNRIDLNVECPSDRVAGREFGAALMRDKDTAVDVVQSMVATSESFADGETIPVSVKTRIGVDDFDSFEHLVDFIQRLIDAGCKSFVIHARKVYMQGFNPAQNRTVPPLNYLIVYKLIDHFPQYNFWLNGGIMNLEHARRIAYGQSIDFDQNGRVFAPSDRENTNMCLEKHSIPCKSCKIPHGSCIIPPEENLPNLRGVMVGRLARDNPAALAHIDRYFYGESTNPCNNRRDLMEKYIQFVERVYPRRCCDDNQHISLHMVMDMPQPIIHTSAYCCVCEEFLCKDVSKVDAQNTLRAHLQEEESTSIFNANVDQIDTKRCNQDAIKIGKAKIVSGIIDCAIKPTFGILFGQRGNTQYRRELHRLSRDTTVRNCGPAYILRKAMSSIPEEVWERPFELNETSSYIPTR